MKMVLEPYHPSFLAAAHAWRHEEASLRYNPLLPTSREDTGRYFAQEGSNFEDLKASLSHRWFFVVGDKPVGTVSLQNISHSMGYGEIGYMVGEEFHGRGYATVGVGLFLEKLFTRSALRRVNALVHEENGASCRVLEKLGFAQEGLLREHYLIRGRPVNEIYFGLLKSDWQNARASGSRKPRNNPSKR